MAALLLAVGAGCAVEGTVEDGVDLEEPSTISAATSGLPTLRQLQPIAIDENQLGALMFASNNPETVTTFGILASSFGAPDVLRSDPVNYPLTANAPAATMVGSTNFDSTCPAGAVRSINVYIAHIMANRGYVGVGVWPTENTTIDTTGDLAIGPWRDTRSTNFVSAQVAKDYYFKNASTQRAFAAAGGRYTQLDAAGGTDGYIDGRLRLTARNGCFWVYTLAQSGPTQATVPDDFARGNVAWPGWFNGQGAGRNAGVYAGEWRVGNQTFALPGPGFFRGYRVGTIEQSVPALFRYADSAAVSFGNYGGLYDQSFTVRNSGAACMNVRAELVSYALVGPDQSPTYAVYNAQRGDLPSVYWNGPIKSLTGSANVVHHAVLFAEKNPSSPNATVGTQRKDLDVVQVPAGQTRSFRYQLPVPGLVSAPAAFVFTSERCN